MRIAFKRVCCVNKLLAACCKEGKLISVFKKKSKIEFNAK